MRLASSGLLLVVASFALGDDALWNSVGSPGNFGKSKDIRMASEEVNIFLRPKSIHVRATFHFVNDGDAQTVTTAFPESMTDYQERANNDPYSIIAFKAWVDGKQVPVIRVPTKRPSTQYSAVWLKQVPFERHGKRTVVCEYEARYAAGLGFNMAYYVLQTGATWKGKIGDCRVHVDWNAIREHGLPGFKKSFSTNYVLGTDMKPIRNSWTTADFQFKSLNPTFNIAISQTNSFWNFRVNGKSPLEQAIDEGGGAMVHGPGSNPTCELLATAILLGSKREIDQAWNENDREGYNLTAVVVRGQQIRIRRSRLLIGRQRFKIVRTHKGRLAEVKIRDVVAGLGGKYRYDKRRKLAIISFPQGKH